MVLANQSNRLSINRGFFDKVHPAELLGARLGEWSIKLIYNTKENDSSLDNAKILIIRQSIYQEIISSLQGERLEDPHAKKFEYRLINYVDSKYNKQDRERIYLRIDKETIRDTLITVMCRIYKHGDFLYIAVDSYALGPLKMGSAIFQAFALIFIFIPLGISGLGSLLTGLGLLFSGVGVLASLTALATGIGLLFVCKLYIDFFWLSVIKALFQKEGFGPALRQGFNRPVTGNSFDVDDGLMFLKILWPLMTESIKSGFSKNEIELKSLEDYLKEIAENSVNQGITVNTGGGGIIGAIFGGNNNSIEG